MAHPIPTWKDVDNGDRRLARSSAASPEQGLDVARDLMAASPDGWHPVRVEIQKSSKGRRASVTVTFQRNRLQ